MQTINLGNIANDGTGDDLRVAFQKVNANFSTLADTIVNSLPTYAENIGETGVGVYKQKVDDVLEFKKLVAGNLAVVTENDTTITINANLTGKDITGIGSISTTGSITSGTFFYGNLQGNVLGNVIGTVYAPIGANAVQGNVVGINGIITNTSDPNYSPALVDGISVQGLQSQLTTFDFGQLGVTTFTNPLSYLLSQIGADFGTFNSPAPFNIDAGSFA